MLYRLNEAADRVFWGVSDRKLKAATHKVYFDGRLVVGGMRVHMCKRVEARGHSWESFLGDQLPFV